MPLTESYWPADDSVAVLELTLHDLLRRAAAAVPDRIALVEGGPEGSARRRWAYAELLAEAEHVASGLLGRFAPGERVAIYAANGPEYVILLHAMALAGVLGVPVNPACRAGELAAILRSAGAGGVVHDAQFRDQNLAANVTQAQAELPELRGAVPLREIARLAGSDAGLPTIEAGDLLQIQYTSGTTGAPKGAMLHHRGLVNTCMREAERMGLPDGGVWVSAMPLFHVGGTTAMVATLSRRGTLVLAPRFEAATILELIESEHATATTLVPTMLQAVLDHPDARSRDLSSLRVIISGGAPVPPVLAHRTRVELRAALSITFGLTEVHGVLTQTHLDDDVVDQCETLGQPLPGVEVKIVDPASGEVCPLDEVGEVVVRGYQTMAGYYEAAEATAEVLDNDGWLRTGDLATMDDRGFLRIAGRLKDVVIRGGENVHPREVEDVLLEHAQVAQVAVLGIPDARWGELVAAVVIPADAVRPPAPGALNAFCRERLAAYKAPARWFFATEFPLTPSGKVQKFALAAAIAAGTLAPDPWTPPQSPTADQTRTNAPGKDNHKG